MLDLAAQLQADRVVVAAGINDPFWAWWRRHLKAQQDNCIIFLTNTPISPDNVYEIAAHQARLRLLTELAKAPYDFLGIPEPR